MDVPGDFTRLDEPRIAATQFFEFVDESGARVVVSVFALPDLFRQFVQTAAGPRAGNRWLNVWSGLLKRMVRDDEHDHAIMADARAEQRLQVRCDRKTLHRRRFLDPSLPCGSSVAIEL